MECACCKAKHEFKRGEWWQQLCSKCFYNKCLEDLDNMKKGIVACPVHGDNETTKDCPNCRPYMKDQAAVSLGKRGGQVKSKAKTKAVRENGKKGGRPKK